MERLKFLALRRKVVRELENNVGAELADDTLAEMMNNHRAGDMVKVTIYRNKKKIDVNVSLAEAREQV